MLPVWSCLEEACLLHDSEELLLADLAIPIPVCFIDHLLDLLIRQALPELLGYSLQVLECDETCGRTAAQAAEAVSECTLLNGEAVVKLYTSPVCHCRRGVPVWTGWGLGCRVLSGS